MLPTYIKRPDGSVYINPAKRFVKPYWLLTEAIGAAPAPEGVRLAAAATSPPISMPIDSAGHFEAFYSMCERIDSVTGLPVASTPTTAATITLFDPGTSRFLMNQPCHIDTMVSGATSTAAQRPFIWPESYFFNVEDAGRSVVAQFTNLAPAGNPLDIFFTLHGRRFYTKEAPPDVYNKMYEYFGKRERTNVYFLTTDISPVNTTIAAPVTVTNTRITDEADMEVHKITAVSTGAFNFLIRDTSTGRALSNGTVTGSTGVGTAEFPFIFPEPLLLERNHEIQITFTDAQVPAANNTIFFTMTGRRLYYAE